VKISLKEYKELISSSKLKRDKKEIISRLVEMKGSIPVFCAETRKFFITDLHNPKRAREVNTRGEKEMCGALLNAMLIKMNESDNEAGVKTLTEMNFGWDIPAIVYNI
jgi:hypothetical protein